MRRLVKMSWVGLVAVAACSGDDAGPDPESQLRDRLGAGVTVTLDPAADAATVHSIVDFGMTMDEFDLDFGLTSGTVVFRADGVDAVLLESVDLDLGDLEITPAAFPPDGLTFTDVRASLVAPVSGPATWTSREDGVVATINGALQVRWSLAQDTGDPLPLSPVDVDDVAFVLEATEPSPGVVRIVLDGNRAGTFFVWADSVTLTNLSTTLTGSD